ncbi:hypothetical protein PMIN06_002597 [Paraphaeosphaeria minitans]
MTRRLARGVCVLCSRSAASRRKITMLSPGSEGDGTSPHGHRQEKERKKKKMQRFSDVTMHWQEGVTVHLLYTANSKGRAARHRREVVPRAESLCAKDAN